jgi:hypothetical protein
VTIVPASEAAPPLRLILLTLLLLIQPEERIADSKLDELDNGDVLCQHQNRSSLGKAFAVDDKENMDLERIIRVGDVNRTSDAPLRA